MTPSRCPNCGFASLFLDPFLLSRMRVGVWDTSTLFVQVDFSKAWAMEHGGRTPLFSGNGPNGQALPHCGTCSSLRGAFDVLPVAELLVVDARTSAACPKQLSTKSTSQEENDSFVYRSRLSVTRVPDGTQFTPGGSHNFGSLNFREPMGWQVSRSYPMSFGG